MLANPNRRCKGLLSTGFSSEAICTRVLSPLTSRGSAPLCGASSGGSQSVKFSIITFDILLMSSSSGNWTLMNIPCVGNGCFFRIWVCVFFFWGGFLSFFKTTPLFEGKYCSVHITVAFTSVKLAGVEFSVSDVLSIALGTIGW